MPKHLTLHKRLLIFRYSLTHSYYHTAKLYKTDIATVKRTIKLMKQLEIPIKELIIPEKHIQIIEKPLVTPNEQVQTLLESKPAEE